MPFKKTMRGKGIKKKCKRAKKVRGLIGWRRKSPLFEKSNLFLSEAIILLRWHLEIGVGPLHAVDEKAFGGFSRNHDFLAPKIPALENAFSGQHIEVTFDLLRVVSVTAVALRRKTAPRRGGRSLVRPLRSSRE